MSIPRTKFWRDKFCGRERNLPFLFACAALVACAGAAMALRAQDKKPFAGDPRAAKVGESHFRANCAVCHGLGARGGGGGPDLTRAGKRRGNCDPEWYRRRDERVPGT